MYKREWKSTYPITEANGNKYAFYCIPYKRNSTCHHMGLGDVKQHCRTLHHKTMEKSVKNTPKVDSFFTSTASNEVNDSVIRAEVMYTNFIVQHNLSFLTADHLAPMYSKMFPVSMIAKKFRCAWTKITAILNNAIHPALHESLLTYMQNRPFSICNDGSSDSGIKKMNPVCVNIFDTNNSSEVQTKFYDICGTTEVDCSKSKTLFNTLNVKFVKDDTHHKKTGFNIEEHQVDLYYIFKKSTCRKGILAN